MNWTLTKLSLALAGLTQPSRSQRPKSSLPMVKFEGDQKQSAGFVQNKNLVFESGLYHMAQDLWYLSLDYTKSPFICYSYIIQSFHIGLMVLTYRY